MQYASYIARVRTAAAKETDCCRIGGSGRRTVLRRWCQCVCEAFLSQFLYGTHTFCSCCGRCRRGLMRKNRIYFIKTSRYQKCVSYISAGNICDVRERCGGLSRWDRILHSICDNIYFPLAHIYTLRTEHQQKKNPSSINTE